MQHLEEEWALLVVDGHTSHDNKETAEIMTKHRIHMEFLPPHTSHFSQPLDISFFRSTKQRFRYNYRRFQHHAGLPMYEEKSNIERIRILESFHQALVATGSNWTSIQDSFATAGIYPPNPSSLLQHKYVLNTKPDSMQSLPI